MEVLHRPGLLYAPQSPGLYAPTMPRMYTSRPDMYTCYSLQVATPSRAPVSDHHHHHHLAYHNQWNTFDTTVHNPTLQSVLRGNVPPTYSHLVPSSLVSSQNTSSKSFYTSSSPSSCVSSHNRSLEVESVYRALSPSPSVHSSLSYNSRPSSRDSHSSQDSSTDPQTEPMDLSCKKTFGKRKAVPAFLDVSPTNSHTSSLPAKTNSSSERISPTTTTNISSPSPSMHRFPPSPMENKNEEFSLLRNLLSIGKHRTTPLSPGKIIHPPPNLHSDTTYDSLISESFLRKHLTGNTQVQLAKKNLFPVSARVSDWLVKIVQFAGSIPEFSALSHNDKITLILNSWTRIMLLYMAESNFQFAVTPVPSLDSPIGGSVHSQEEPTMKAVEGMQAFIKKCQQMAVDGKEYEFFRMLVLFNSGYPGLSCPETIDQLSSVVQQLLQQHVRVSRPRDLMHYSRLLMCLPCLYSINGRMFESLFCKHITKSTDMEVLLKELLQNIP